MNRKRFMATTGFLGFNFLFSDSRLFGQQIKKKNKSKMAKAKIVL